MTITEVCQELRKECKPYIGKLSQPHFSMYMMRIESGTAKMSTVRDFFNLFGYTGDWNEWQRTTIIDLTPKHLARVGGCY